MFLLEGVAKAALYCARRTSTFLSCAFREQEGHLAIPVFASKLPSPTIITQTKQGYEMPSTAAVERGPSEGARSGSKESFSYPCARIRRHEHEDFETLVCVILHAMLFSDRRHRPLPRAQHLFL